MEFFEAYNSVAGTLTIDAVWLLIDKAQVSKCSLNFFHGWSNLAGQHTVFTIQTIL